MLEVGTEDCCREKIHFRRGLNKQCLHIERINSRRARIFDCMGLTQAVFNQGTVRE